MNFNTNQQSTKSIDSSEQKGIGSRPDPFQGGAYNPIDKRHPEEKWSGSQDYTHS